MRDHWEDERDELLQRIKELEELHESDKNSLGLILKKWNAERELLKCCGNCQHEVYKQFDIRGAVPIICDYCENCSKWDLKK